MTEKAEKPFDPTDTSHPLYNAAKDPTHPFYEGDNAASDSKPDPSDGSADKAGPGNPPKQFRWKKNGPSPNPRGRPPKVLSMKPDLKKALEAALNEKVVITKDKKEIVLTKAALGIQQLVNQFAKGDRHARRDLFQYAALLGIDLHAKDLITEALGLNDQAIVDAAFQRRQQQPSQAPDDHVKAPPDLVDDDVAAKSEPASPQSDTAAKQPVGPGRDAKPKLDVSDILHIRAERERNLAKQEKNQGES